MAFTNVLLVVVIGVLVFQQLRLASFANDWTREILQLSVIRHQLQDMRVAIKMESGMGFEEADSFFPEKKLFSDDDEYEDKFLEKANDIDRRYHLAWKRRHQESQKSLTSGAWWSEL